MRRRLTAGLLTAGLLLLTAGQAVAASPAVFAATSGPSFWSRFKQHWASTLAAQNGVTLIVVLCGILSLFIITRGKWKR